MRDGVPLPGTTPPVVLSQLAYRVFGPLRTDRVRAMLDCLGLAGLPADPVAVVAARHGVSTVTLNIWSKMLAAAGSRHPLPIELVTELARRTRTGEDHLGRVRAVGTFGLAAPRPPRAQPTFPPATAAPMSSRSDRAAAWVAGRILAAVGPLRMSTLHQAVTRARRARSRPLIASQQLASALRAIGATRDDRGLWRAPEGLAPPARYRALVAVAAGRDLTRQEMIDALRVAGYTEMSANMRKISSHPLIHRDGPNRFVLIGGDLSKS
ncbi:hypothetical protein [Nakamurella multipartita]|nr:hypothetical protein [Nakamurella multipartita]